MITLEHLQALYSDGKIQKCNEEATIFLLLEEGDTDVLLIKAKCSFELGKNCYEEQDAIFMFITAYENLQKVLSKDSINEEALLLASNICIHYLEENLPTAISYCIQLQSSVNLETTFKAYEYLQQAYILSNDADNALIIIDQYISLTNQYYINDRSTRDTLLNWVYIRKAYVYLELKWDSANALKAYKDGFMYATIDRTEDIFIAKFAFKNNDNDFGIAVLYNVLINEYNGSYDDLLLLNSKIQELLENDTCNSKLFSVAVLIMKTMLDKGLLDEDENEQTYEDNYEDQKSEIIIFCKQYIKLKPNWHEPYYFAGIELLEEENYAEAFNYFNQSLEKGANASVLCEYIIAGYKATGILPEINYDPNDLPVEYFYAGASIDNIEDEIKNDDNLYTLIAIRNFFYERSYNSFYAYFYEGKGSSQANMIEIFCSCCNNYGYVLRQLREYEKAIEVHKLGYSLSPRFENLVNWAMTLLDIERYEESIDINYKALAYTNLSFENFLRVRVKILEATFKLDKVYEAKRMLISIDEDYNSFLEYSKNNMKENNLQIIDKLLVSVQNFRKLLFLNPNDNDSAIIAWNDVAINDGNDGFAFYKLTGLYHIAEDYGKTIHYGNGYLTIMAGSIKPEKLAAICYHIGIAQIELGNYIEGIKMLEKRLILSDEGYPPISLGKMYIDYYMTIAFYSLQKWDDCLKYSWSVIDWYKKNNMKWDDKIKKATLYYADTCKVTGQNAIAVKAIENILINDPNNTEALQRKNNWKKRGLFSFFKK